ncbi:MAG: ArsR/SmtB family transcription factor, partial [Notoacmeibacter sp.]
MDAIFKALNDKTRRRILDLLREENGLTLSELVSKLETGRFGVMKHLAVLETAGLVAARKIGRFKYHYLNAAQIQFVLD